MTTYVALLRGINVGGHRQIRMDELKGLHEALGFGSVVTYIQSGNVVFKSDDTEADTGAVRALIEENIEQRFGFRVEVLVRTAAELSALIERNPFKGQEGKESKWIAVFFLATRPGEAERQELLQSYAGPEEIVMLDREIYIYYPTGMGRSKLSHTLIERRLQTIGTARNWNTVLKLQELTQRTA